MNYRLATILARESQAADTTKVIDLKLKDAVSQFIVIYEPYNSASGTPTAHPARCVTKIELVDGSDVLFALSGVEAQAADFYHRKEEPANHLIYLPTMYAEEVYNLNFGRHLLDPELAFDPSKFDNPQLKITLDIDAGGSTVTLGYLTVLAMIFDEKAVTPIGFLMHKEIKDYALGAGTHEYTDLPTDFPYRKLFARIQKYGTGTEYCFTNIKLTEDNDRRIPVNHTISQIIKAMVGQTRPYQEFLLSEGSTTAFYTYCTPAYWPTSQATQWRPTPSAALTAVYEGDGGRLQVRQQTATSNLQILVTGWCPHGAIEIPFGLQAIIDDWYDVTNLGSLLLDITAGSGMASTDSCQVFLQQMRKYAA